MIDNSFDHNTDHNLLLECPHCGLPAEITERFTLGGVPGPVEHVKLVCVVGHWFTPPADQVQSQAPRPTRVRLER